jgi:sulfur carrier protein
MKITLNGNSHELDAALPLNRFLETLGLAGKPVVIELNEQAIFPRDYDQVMVESGSRVEVVTLAAGG